MNTRQEIYGENDIIVHLEGKLNFQDHTEFNALINNFQNTKKTITFDLSALEAIDSAGIGMLFLAHKIITKMGGHLHLKNPQGQVRRVFEITSIDKQLQVTQTKS